MQSRITRYSVSTSDLFTEWRNFESGESHDTVKAWDYNGPLTTNESCPQELISEESICQSISEEYSQLEDDDSSSTCSEMGNMIWTTKAQPSEARSYEEASYRAHGPDAESMAIGFNFNNMKSELLKWPYADESGLKSKIEGSCSSLSSPSSNSSGITQTSSTNCNSSSGSPKTNNTMDFRIIPPRSVDENVSLELPKPIRNDPDMHSQWIANAGFEMNDSGTRDKYLSENELIFAIGSPSSCSSSAITPPATTPSTITSGLMSSSTISSGILQSNAIVPLSELNEYAVNHRSMGSKIGVNNDIKYRQHTNLMNVRGGKASRVD